MQVCSTKAEFRGFLDNVRALGRTVGLVPTMGALHDGHLSLLRAATAECDVVALTIFVNPLQFAAGEDLSAYPRPLERDLELAEAAGTDVVFTPNNAEMYPVPVVTTVHVDGLTAPMEGAARPTHFDGVTTVVAKLFNIAGTCRAYFGEKDFQQLAVIRRLVRDLDVPVKIISCPTVREADGLAMSSRNARLSPAQRADAPRIRRALAAASKLRSPEQVLASARADIEASPLARIDYLALVDAETLQAAGTLDHPTILATAVFYGEVRLIDHVRVEG